MQVILLKDIQSLGKAGEVRNVSDGYATNFLIPQKLATPATEQKLAELKARQAKSEREGREQANEKQNLAIRLQGLKMEIKAKASQGGKLFAGITAKDIIKELKIQRKLVVSEKSIKLEKHIKDIGEHAIVVDLGQGVKANIIIKIIPLA